MNSKELFGLFLRIVGVLGITYVFRNMVVYVEQAGPIGAFYVVSRLVYLIIGAYLIRGAPLVVKFAYPEKGSEATAPKS
jgi:hypothetical protein